MKEILDKYENELTEYFTSGYQRAIIRQVFSRLKKEVIKKNL